MYYKISREVCNQGSVEEEKHTEKNILWRHKYLNAKDAECTAWLMDAYSIHEDVMTQSSGNKLDELIRS